MNDARGQGSQKKKKKKNKKKKKKKKNDAWKTGSQSLRL
jgi:hypothetical protein